VDRKERWVSQPLLDIEHEIFVLFRRAFTLHVRTSVGKYELDRSTYGILLLLDDGGPLRLGQIALAYGLDPSTITRQVQGVVSHGLAEKRPDPDDRRATLLSITAEGRATLAAVREQRGRLLDAIMAGWSDRQRNDLLAALRRVNDALEALVETSVSADLLPA
jgi:DNA-binding MarR family transcriptional regulator